MAIAGREHAARQVDRQVKLGAGGQMACVVVSRPLGCGQHAGSPGPAGSHTHSPAPILDRATQGVVPLVGERVAPDRVVARGCPSHQCPGPDTYGRAAGAALSLIGAALARSTFLSNLPTEVLGPSSMNRTSSGSHHLATLSRRKSITSSWVTLPLNSGLGTANATGRSSHLGWTRPITAASMIFGWAMMAFSSSTEEIHSPPDLITSLVRSTISM